MQGHNAKNGCRLCNTPKRLMHRLDLDCINDPKTKEKVHATIRNIECVYVKITSI
jgi:hypothetical protein